MKNTVSKCYMANGMTDPVVPEVAVGARVAISDAKQLVGLSDFVLCVPCLCGQDWSICFVLVVWEP